MTTKKKRRLTYDQLRRLLTIAEQHNRMLARKIDELETTNIALAVQINDLGAKLFDMEWSKIMRGYNARNMRQRGLM
jgi:hypothetical protein